MGGSGEGRRILFARRVEKIGIVDDIKELFAGGQEFAVSALETIDDSWKRSDTPWMGVMHQHNAASFPMLSLSSRENATESIDHIVRTSNLEIA